MNYILDYRGRKTVLPFHIEDSKVKAAHLDVIAGDEILNVVIEHEDGSIGEEFYDSGDSRVTGYFDASCFLKVDGKITYPDNVFERRTRSYGYYDPEG